MVSETFWELDFWLTFGKSFHASHEFGNRSSHNAVVEQEICFGLSEELFWIVEGPQQFLRCRLAFVLTDVAGKIYRPRVGLNHQPFG